MGRVVRAACGMVLLATLNGGCAQGPQPGVEGVYQSWDDVITRWIGRNREDLYYELGPPNLHPQELENGLTAMAWDMTIDRMPGQADEYHTLPQYGRTANCQLVFVADAKGTIVSGRRIGCE